jgi:hypothetical protein
MFKAFLGLSIVNQKMFTTYIGMQLSIQRRGHLPSVRALAFPTLPPWGAGPKDLALVWTPASSLDISEIGSKTLSQVSSRWNREKLPSPRYYVLKVIVIKVFYFLLSLLVLEVVVVLL